MASKIRKKYRQLRSWRWNIALCDTPVEDLLQGKEMKLRWLKHEHRGGWFADPFILSANDREVEFLVEEFVYADRKGRISRLVADRKSMELKEIHPVLDIGCHLSFPAIMRIGEEVYIYPESCGDSNLVLYRYDRSTDTCEAVTTVSDRPLTDATVNDIAGRRYLLTTSLPDANGSTLEIRAIDKDCREGERLQTVKFSRNNARNAGAVFENGGRYYRPAQETVGHEYGAAVWLQEIDVDASGRLTFTDKVRLTSPHPDLRLGFHTFNKTGDLIVVDAKGYRYPHIAPVIEVLRKVVKRDD